MKRIITDGWFSTIDEKWNFEKHCRTWAYGYISGTSETTNNMLYAVIIADDNIFEGK